MEDSLDVSWTAEEATYAMLTLLLDLSAEEVGPWLGWREFVLVEQMDVAFGSIRLILGIRGPDDTRKAVVGHVDDLRK